jgi:SAM-dependent methyltransferase
MAYSLFLLSLILINDPGESADPSWCHTAIISTRDHYNNNAQAYKERHMKVTPTLEATRNRFLTLMKPGGLVLDLGSGPGRDSIFFREKGLVSIAADPSIEMLKIASDEFKLPTLLMKAQDLNAVAHYDGIWAMASLIHVPNAELATTLARP